MVSPQEFVYKQFVDEAQSSNLSTQYLKNQTSLQVTNQESFTFGDIDISSTCSSTVSTSVPSGTSNVTTACNNKSWSGDYLTGVQEFQFSEGQDTVKTSNLSVQYVANQTSLQVTNQLGFELGNVSIGSQCTDTKFVSVPAGTSNVTTYCDAETGKGDWLDHSVYDFKVGTSEVVLGTNYAGRRALEVVEKKGLTWSGVETTGGVSSPVQCTQINNSKVDVAAGAAQNFSVRFSCSPGSVVSPQLDPVNESTGETVFYNATLRVASNETEETRVTWKIDESNLKNWTGRDADSAKAVINGKSSDIDLIDGDGWVYVTVQTDFGNSSLHEGDHNASLIYTLGKSGSGGGTTIIGGGGGGVSEPSTAAYFSAPVYTVGPGDTLELPFYVYNKRDEENVVRVRVPNTPECSPFQVETRFPEGQGRDREYSDTGRYEVPASSTAGFYSENGSYKATVWVEVSMPSESELKKLNESLMLNCELETGSSAGPAKGLVFRVHGEESRFAALVQLIGTEIQYQLGQLFGGPMTEICTGSTSEQLETGGEGGCGGVSRLNVPLLVLLVVIGFVAAGSLWRWRKQR